MKRILILLTLALLFSCEDPFSPQVVDNEVITNYEELLETNEIVSVFFTAHVHTPWDWVGINVDKNNVTNEISGSSYATIIIDNYISARSIYNPEITTDGVFQIYVYSNYVSNDYHHQKWMGSVDHDYIGGTLEFQL